MLRPASLCAITTRYCSPAALTTVQPALTTLGVRFFATNPKRDEELSQKTYSDNFDESDALEMGKKEKNVATTRGRGMLGYHRRRHPIFRPLFGGFEEFFHNDPFFTDFFRDDPFFHRPAMPVLDRWEKPKTNRSTLLRSSPGYEINESDGSYEICVDIPQNIKASDMKIELEHDGTVLHLSGGRRTNQEGVETEEHFDKRFTIGTNVDTEHIHANLDDGVLVLTAPKLPAELPLKRTIPITETPHRFALSRDELMEKTYGDAFDESDWAETGKAGHEK